MLKIELKTKWEIDTKEYERTCNTMFKMMLMTIIMMIFNNNDDVNLTCNVNDDNNIKGFDDGM